MSNHPWRAVLAAWLALLAAIQDAHGADAPAQPGVVPSWWSSAALGPLAQFGVTSWADVLRPGLWNGALALGFDTQRQTIRAAGSPEQQFSSRLSNESFSIGNQGFSLIDPRLVNANIGVRYALEQVQTRAADSTTSEHGSLTDYNFDATLLGEMPYSPSFFANRSQSITTQPSGGTTNAEIENRGFVFRVREDNILRDKELLPYFSANMRVLQENNKELTSVAGQSFRRDDERRIAALDFHNGTETSDLNFQFEHTEFTNHVYEPGTYRSQSANLVYSRDFGPTLNRRWDSRANYYSRTGSTSLSNFALTELLTVDHHVNLSSSYNYQLSRQTTPDGNVTVQNAGMSVQHRLYSNLSTNLGLSGLRQALPNGRIETNNAQLDFSYNHSLPWKGQLYGALGGSYQLTNNQVPAGLVQVTDASYEAPRQLGAGSGILLKDRFILEDSIVVIAIKGGARVTTAAGVDYSILADSERTTVLPLPGSAIIQPGDTLLVSYRYRVDPSARFRTTSGSINVGVDWQWIGLSVAHYETSQKSLSGGEDGLLLSGERRDSARLDLRGDWDTFDVRADATLQRYEDNRLNYLERRMNQRISYFPIEGLTLNLSASEYRTTYRNPDRETSGNAIRLDADWFTTSGWLTTAYATRRYFSDTQVPSETVSDAGVKLRRRWALLDVSIVLGVADRVRGGVQSRNGHFSFSAIRRF